MNIKLVLILFVTLLAELHASSLDLQEELSIRHNLEEVPDDIIPPSFGPQEPEKYDPKASPYSSPQTALNDRMFVIVEEYPDGYTGYHCSIIGNFRYTLELCSPHVWECIDGKLFKKTCGTSIMGQLVFWFSEEVCTFSDFEPTCNYFEKLPQGTNWPLKFIHAARVKNETYDPLMITTDCTKVMSGFFAVKECFPAAIYCSAGILRLQPAPLKDNSPEKQEIVPWDDEPETIELRRQLSPFSPFVVTTDCRNKKLRTFHTGYEIGKCHQNYVVCQYGERVILSCRTGEAFSLRKDGCIKLEECEATWDQWKELPNPPYPPPVRNTPAPIQTEDSPSLFRTPEEIVLVSTGKECVAKKSGNYAMSPCQNEYMNCSSNTGKTLKCSEGFVFSRRFLECVGKEFCEE